MSQSSVELPEAPWFRLSHYESVAQWTDLGWFRAISGRLAVEQFIAHPTPGVLPGEMHSVARDHFESIWKDPIMPGTTLIAEPGRSNALFLRGGRTDVDELAFARPINEVPNGKVADHFMVLLKEYGRLLLVDLAATDESILKTFEAWLAHQRKSSPHNSNSRITASDLKGWVDARVLPYIDLDLWGRAVGKRITAARIAGAIFGDLDNADGIDLTDRVRKVTRRHAARVLSKATYRRLSGQLGSSRRTWP